MRAKIVTGLLLFVLIASSSQASELGRYSAPGIALRYDPQLRIAAVSLAAS